MQQKAYAEQLAPLPQRKPEKKPPIKVLPARSPSDQKAIDDMVRFEDRLGIHGMDRIDAIEREIITNFLLRPDASIADRLAGRLDLFQKREQVRSEAERMLLTLIPAKKTNAEAAVSRDRVFRTTMTDPAQQAHHDEVWRRDQEEIDTLANSHAYALAVIDFINAKIATLEADPELGNIITHEAAEEAEQRKVTPRTYIDIPLVGATREKRNRLIEEWMMMINGPKKEELEDEILNLHKKAIQIQDRLPRPYHEQNIRPNLGNFLTNMVQKGKYTHHPTHGKYIVNP